MKIETVKDFVYKKYPLATDFLDDKNPRIKVDERVILLDELILEAKMDSLKEKKTTEISQAKKAYQSKPISEKIGKKTFTIFGGEKAYDKYEKAYMLANRAGLAKGKILTPTGVVDVTKNEMEVLLNALGSQIYRGEMKEGYYLQAIAQATTVEEVEAIVWEDERVKSKIKRGAKALSSKEAR